MIKINLVPADFLEKQKQQHYVLQAVAAGVLVIGLIGVVTFVQFSKAGKLEAELKQKEQVLQRLQVVLQEVRNLETETAAVKAHLDAINGLMATRLVYSYFMQDLVRSLPSSIWFGNLQTTNNGTVAVNFSANCMARSSEDLAEWINTLETSGKYSGVDIGAISVSVSDSGKTLSFPVQAVYQAAK